MAQGQDLCGKYDDYDRDFKDDQAWF